MSKVTEAYQKFPSILAGSERWGHTQVMISTVKSVKAMQNHMKENCDLIYGAPSLP
jgi:hypothetical protein